MSYILNEEWDDDAYVDTPYPTSVEDAIADDLSLDDESDQYIIELPDDVWEQMELDWKAYNQED